MDYAEGDEVPWNSAYVNWVFNQVGISGTRSGLARSWLLWGNPLSVPVAGCVVILKRGSAYQPGPEVIDAPGHVGFFMGIEDDKVLVLGGNQNDSVNPNVAKNI